MAHLFCFKNVDWQSIRIESWPANIVQIQLANLDLHACSCIRSHRETKVVFPDFQPMRVSEEPICIYLLGQNPVFTSLHLRFPIHVVPPQGRWWYTLTRRTPWLGPPSTSASPDPTRRSSSIHKRDCSRNSSTISGVIFYFYFTWTGNLWAGQQIWSS